MCFFSFKWKVAAKFPIVLSSHEQFPGNANPESVFSQPWNVWSFTVGIIIPPKYPIGGGFCLWLELMKTHISLGNLIQIASNRASPWHVPTIPTIPEASQGSDRDEEDFEDDERLEERSLHQDLSGMAWPKFVTHGAHRGMGAGNGWIWKIWRLFRFSKKRSSI